MDALLGVLVEFSQQLLADHGEFYPHAATVRSDGEVALAAADLGEESPGAQDLVDLLYDGLSRQAAAGEIRAAGIAADVQVVPEGSERTDAIRVSIEHESAEPVHVFLPYSKKKLRGIQYGELFAAPGERRVFAG